MSFIPDSQIAGKERDIEPDMRVLLKPHSHPQCQDSYNNATPPNPSKQFNWSQTLKHMNLGGWGQSHPNYCNFLEACILLALYII